LREAHVGERGERDKSMRACKAREQETIDSMLNGPREYFSEQAGVAFVRSPQAIEIAIAILLMNNRGWVAMPYEKQVENQPTRSAVSVVERMDPFEFRVKIGELFDGVRSVYVQDRSGNTGFLDPIVYERANVG
jgi:hypothetical protein